MELSEKLLIVVVTISSFLLDGVYSLECYACLNQDTNNDKCIKTTKQCEEHQDICMTKIKWGLPPYWTPYGDRMHYIDKDCERREACQNEGAETNPRWCKRDWYDDWSCVECCSGDLCNYYVTMAAGTVRTNGVITMAGITLAWAAMKLFGPR